MTCNGLYLGEYTDVSFGYSMSGADPALLEQAYAIAMNDGRVPGHFALPAITAEADVGETLTAERKTWLNKAVTASVEEFDKVYDEGLANYLSIGGQAIIDERIEKLTAAGYTYNK
jgi:putative aldouronate transport system substrate-binding protein